MRTLFFGDGAWATNSLQRLIREECTLLGIVVRVKPTDPALVDLAEKMRLPVFQPERVNDPQFVAEVEGLQPDLNISVSYDQILRRPILETAPCGFVNFHAGKLPYYRGRNVINWAIINGEKEIGLTAHYMDEGIDTGDIILQRTLAIAWADTYGDVLGNVTEAFPGLVADAVHLIAAGLAERRRQSDQVGTYFSARGEDDEWLDWSNSSCNLYNKIRAITHPGPGAKTLLGQRVVTIWRALYDTSWPTYIATPGQVVGRRPGKGVVVKTGDSTILLQEVQTDGEGPLLPTWPIGTSLEINPSHQLVQLLVHVKRLTQEIECLKGKSIG